MLSFTILRSIAQNSYRGAFAVRSPPDPARVNSSLFTEITGFFDIILDCSTPDVWG
jgi:hypothetical protein